MKTENVTIEVTQVLNAFVTGLDGKERPAAKLQANPDGEIKVWLAGRDPVTITDADLAPLIALLQSAFTLLSSNAFDPSDPETTFSEQPTEVEEVATKVNNAVAIGDESGDSNDTSFDEDESDDF